LTGCLPRPRSETVIDGRLKYGQHQPLLRVDALRAALLLILYG
jgi:hypothetical protein